MLSREYFDKAVAFHGHVCPGLAIGFKAVEGAIDLLSLKDDALPAIDEEIVCVTENDACGVDAVQVLLGCTYGKSNLIPRIRGKMAFTFYKRATGEGVRLVIKNESDKEMTREERVEYMLSHPYTDIFDVKEPQLPLPEPARLFSSHTCALCGETTAEFGLRVQDGKLVCIDCYDAYQREGF